MRSKFREGAAWADSPRCERQGESRNVRGKAKALLHSRGLSWVGEDSFIHVLAGDRTPNSPTQGVVDHERWTAPGNEGARIPRSEVASNTLECRCQIALTQHRNERFAP